MFDVEMIFRPSIKIIVFTLCFTLAVSTSTVEWRLSLYTRPNPTRKPIDPNKCFQFFSLVIYPFPVVG
jgi:hypothetical protein